MVAILEMQSINRKKRKTIGKQNRGTYLGGPILVSRVILTSPDSQHDDLR